MLVYICIRKESYQILWYDKFFVRNILYDRF